MAKINQIVLEVIAKHNVHVYTKGLQITGLLISRISPWVFLVLAVPVPDCSANLKNPNTVYFPFPFYSVSRGENERYFASRKPT